MLLFAPSLRHCQPYQEMIFHDGLLVCVCVSACVKGRERKSLRAGWNFYWSTPSLWHTTVSNYGVCVYTHACVCECGGGGMTNQQCPSTSEKHFQISLHSIRKLLFGRNLDSRRALYPLNTKTSLERIKMDNVSRSTSLNWAVSGWAETKLAFSRVRSAIQCLWSSFPSENSREEKHPRVTVFRMLTLRNEYLWLINTCKSSSFCSFENQAPRSTN